MNINVFLNDNILSIVVALFVLALVLTVISIVSLLEVIKLKKRYEQFTGGKKHAEYNLETQFDEYHKSAKIMEERYTKLADMIRDIDKNMEKCVQKVGVVRYNPFDEVGGNLSYAVALLDSNNNGVILNGIHSRTGSFTYAKPVELGVSEYVLSEEESQALEMALAEGYTPENRQAVLDELEAAFPKAYAANEKRRKGRKNEAAELSAEKEAVEGEIEEEVSNEDEMAEDTDISSEIAAILSASEKTAVAAKN
jgi:competence protein ComGC